LPPFSRSEVDQKAPPEKRASASFFQRLRPQELRHPNQFFFRFQTLEGSSPRRWFSPRFAKNQKRARDDPLCSSWSGKKPDKLSTPVSPTITPFIFECRCPRPLLCFPQMIVRAFVHQSLSIPTHLSLSHTLSLAR